MEELSLVPDADNVRRISLVLSDDSTRTTPGTKLQQYRASRSQDVQPQSATVGAAATTLCHKCRNMHFIPYEDCSLDLQGAVIQSPYASLYYLHSPGLDSLMQTADSGCPFCKTIAHRFLMDTEIWNDTRVAGEQIVFNLSLNCDDQGVGTPCFDNLTVYSCERNWFFQYESDLPVAFQKPLAALASPNSAAGDGNAEDPMYSYWTDSSTLSEANMELASTWSHLCLSEHPGCSIDTEYILPTRVIRIKGPRDFVLEDGEERCLPYLTLSYKWGDTKRYCTLTENIANHKQKILFDALPKTFQHALLVTERLGFDYLWIDALCIIHDSPEDLQNEISQMGSIYQASTITLFAEAGDDSEAGLSIPRDPRMSKPCKLDFRATFDSRVLEVSRYACYNPFNLLHTESKQSPLQKRGWVLQEELLSPRLLKFGSRQLKWECRHSTLCESLPHDHKRNATMRPKNHELRSWMYDCRAAQDSDGQRRKDMFTCWCELVENYCKRSLTYANDVLPAIAGIANVFAKNNQLSYINGLWKEDLPLGLLWAVHIGDSAHTSHSSHQQAIDRPDAPSWTWLSQWDKSVEFEQKQLRHWAESYDITIDQLGHADDDLEETAYGQDESPSDQTMSFQQVDTRPLRFRGYLIKADVELGSWSPWFPQAWGRRVTTRHTREDMGLFFPDSDPFKEPILEVTCCLCVVCEDRHSAAYMWLALVSTSQPDVYKRVGMGRLTIDDKTQPLPSYWEAEGKATFTLV